MFLSSFFGIIDSKNRIAIPSSYRATIKETQQKVYLFKSLKYPCLEIHLASKINSLVKSFDGSQQQPSRERFAAACRNHGRSRGPVDASSGCHHPGRGHVP